MGNADAALELVRGMLARASASKAWRAWCRSWSACEATRCSSKATCGARAGARGEPRRGQGAEQPVRGALTMLSLIELDRWKASSPRSRW